MWSLCNIGRNDKNPYLHDRRADKDFYPHDRNVTDYLCSLIKLCFAFIMANFFDLMCFIVIHVENYFKKCFQNHLKEMHNRHRQKREKQVIDHSTGDKN